MVVRRKESEIERRMKVLRNVLINDPTLVDTSGNLKSINNTDAEIRQSD